MHTPTAQDAIVALINLDSEGPVARCGEPANITMAKRIAEQLGVNFENAMRIARDQRQPVTRGGRSRGA